jgi:hypothetical protein
MPQAPEAIIELVKCGCVKQRCSTNRCQCHNAGLSCTELCTCYDYDDDACENTFEGDNGDDVDNSDDDVVNSEDDEVTDDDD